MRLLLLAATGLALGAPAPAAAQAPVTTKHKPTTKPSPPTTLTKVDWANRSYGRRMRLRNGRYAFRRYLRRDKSGNRRCMHTSQTARLVKTHYGDLNGDGKQDALVEIRTYANYCAGRGHKRQVLVAFTSTQQGVVELGRISLADVQSDGVAKKTVHVQRRAAKDGKWLMCREALGLKHDKFVTVSSKCTVIP